MGRGRRLVDAFLGAPDYPPEPADTATTNIVGLRLPIRATVAICAMVAGLLIDFHRDFLPREVIYSQAPDVLRIATLQRFILVGLVPLAIVLFLFRDHPRRYGLRIGDWRAGLILAGIGTAVMLPLVIWAGHQPDFAAYYSASTKSAPDVAITNVLDVFGAEFLFRGFLMFTLIRTVGPLGRAPRGRAVHVRPPGQARARDGIDAARRDDLRVAGLADRLDPLQRDRPRDHPDGRDVRVGRLGLRPR